MLDAVDYILLADWNIMIKNKYPYLSITAATSADVVDCLYKLLEVQMTVQQWWIDWCDDVAFGMVYGTSGAMN